MAPGTPSWHEIATTRVFTKAYVPKGAKGIWGQCVAAGLNQILVHGDDKAWRDWYMLPKAVLRSANRGGGKTARTKEKPRRECGRRLGWRGNGGSFGKPPDEGKTGQKNQRWGTVNGERGRKSWPRKVC